MPALAQVFERHGPAYLAKYAHRMLPSHRRALEDILTCRTASRGGHLARCTRCGHQHFSYHSCRNRACPQCHTAQTERWIEKRRQELLPVPYFHLVFTLPEPLRPLVRSRQKTLYRVLLQTAARALLTLAADPRFLGGRIGILCVLHTWTRTLIFHPHVHCLVPAGAQLPDGRWRSSHPKYLVPVKPLSRLFRGRFMEAARKALPRLILPQSVWNTPWVVYCKRTLTGPERVLEYLGRYVHRVAITNRRIVLLDERFVTFRYWDRRSETSRTMRLPALEFLRRFLQHVLPSGFHKVRYYGLLSPSLRHHLPRIRHELLGEDKGSSEPTPGVNSPDSRPRCPLPPFCPLCRAGFMVPVFVVAPRGRAPP